ncbi:uncharacterized protein T551_00103 [Pneumocystis jirovecii RU7]|uniref:CCZ1/INTU/HSP4 first Longin domain-containing protein n=1 Tax=Pneumocystis jirovecii (strain RU7) TaxID=1408657 RepID=A0A0W4ZW60_PNEJ7|nr:uncharacterized protein T551_00103 [Pneumocystis jirovecii RU7]KTW32618.1 hypothetical protein T551_00103 [Pneumocystis jirovecii RU7]
MTSVRFSLSNKCPLSYLAIFNPSLGLSEGSLHHQILFFMSETLLSSDDQLRNIGLIQGILQFSENFKKKVFNEYIQSENYVIIITQVEDGWYIVAVSNKSFSVAFLKTNPIFCPPFTVLFHYLCNGYEQYKLIYGLFSHTLQIKGRDVLETQLNEWWSKWVWNLDLTLNDLSVLYNAIDMSLTSPDFYLEEKLIKSINELKANNDRILDLIISTVLFPFPDHHTKHNKGCLYAGDGSISKNNVKILYNWLKCEINEFFINKMYEENMVQEYFENNTNQDKKGKTVFLTSDSCFNSSNNNYKPLGSSWMPINLFALPSISIDMSNFVSFMSGNKSLENQSAYNYNSKNNMFKNNTLGYFIYGLVEKNGADSIISEKKLYLGNQINENIINSTLNDEGKNFSFKTLSLNTEIDSQYISISIYYSYPFIYMIPLRNQNIDTKNSENIFIKNNIFYIDLQCSLERMTAELQSYFMDYSRNYPSFFWHIIFDPNTRQLYNNIPLLNDDYKKNENIEKNLSTKELLHIHCYVLKIFDQIINTEKENELEEYILKTSWNFWICYLHSDGKHIILIMKKDKNKENLINDSFENVFQEAKKYVSELLYTPNIKI